MKLFAIKVIRFLGSQTKNDVVCPEFQISTARNVLSNQSLLIVVFDFITLIADVVVMTKQPYYLF